MSRIEKAMERAAQLRQSSVVVPEADQVTAQAAVPESRPVHTPPPVVATTILDLSSPFLVNLNDPYSPIAEEYRKLKAALVNATKGDGFFRNSLMVASAVPNEGKSLTALNLAISLAQEYDHTVLLIDANFRKPSIHHYLGFELKSGFSDCLLGEAQVSEVIIPTGIGRLSVMSAGREIPNPVELFASQKTGAMITEMKNRYNDRFLIFDTPSVLPFAEARTLARLVDGVLFVVREHLVLQKNVTEALDALKGCKQLGMVYNDIYFDHADEKYFSYKFDTRVEK